MEESEEEDDDEGELSDALGGDGAAAITVWARVDDDELSGEVVGEVDDKADGGRFACSSLAAPAKAAAAVDVMPSRLLGADEELDLLVGGGTLDEVKAAPVDGGAGNGW